MSDLKLIRWSRCGFWRPNTRRGRRRAFTKLDWLLDHRAEFELLVIKTYGNEAADQTDWTTYDPVRR